MKAIHFPDGDVVALMPGMNCTVLGAVLTLSYLGTTVKTYTASNFQTAQAMRKDIFNPDLPALVMLREPFSIIGISTNPFALTTDTITITGTGFRSATVGKLYVEDAAGGLDFNGAYMACTFVDENTLTAVYGGPGDGGTVAGNVVLGYQDTAGNKSNALAGSYDGTNVTVQNT